MKVCSCVIHASLRLGVYSFSCPAPSLLPSLGHRIHSPGSCRGYLFQVGYADFLIRECNKAMDVLFTTSSSIVQDKNPLLTFDRSASNFRTWQGLRFPVSRIM